MKTKVIFFIIVILLGASLSFMLAKPKAVKKYVTRFLKIDVDSNEEMKNIGSTNIVNPRVKEIQQRLLNTGYFSGKADGSMSIETRKVIKKFQKAKGIEATGKINNKTFLALQRQDLKSVKDVSKNKKRTISKKNNSVDSLKVKIKEIQAMLKDSGLYHGKIDGVLGKETIKAIKKFEGAGAVKDDGKK